VASDRITIDAGGQEVEISHPEKVFFPERGETKIDLVQYYLAVAGPLMAEMRDRPVLLERYPEGAGGSSFFQKRVPATRPEWLETSVVSTPNGTKSEALVAANVAHLLWAVNMGCLGFHVWPTTAR
jgi:DNA primase